MQRSKGSGGTELFIYPCFFVSLELTFAALFISFGLITTATLWGGGRGCSVDKSTTAKV